MATIVMVDDDELLCAIVARTLAPVGHTVVAVRDGDDALDILWECGPDLAILDCALPGKTGLTILREIRQSAMFHTLPVLILTARRSEWHSKVAMEAGANDYVRKPFDPGELVDKIEHLLATAAGSSDMGTLIDLARLADLRAAVGHAQADTLLAMMTTDIAERTSRIAALLADGDIAQAIKQAHALRGAADGIGALDLVHHCRAIEQQTERGSEQIAACATATIAAIAQARGQAVTSSA
jgi:DNA-binding response OmpR family regulator